MFANCIKGIKVFQAKDQKKENMSHLAKCGILKHAYMDAYKYVYKK